MKKRLNTISVHEMQAKASKVIKDVEAGQEYQIMRYSKPVARIISEEEYKCLTGECRGCVQELVAELKSEARNPKSLPSRQAGETNPNDKNLKI